MCLPPHFSSELAKARNSVIKLVQTHALGGEFRLSVMLVDKSGAEQEINLNNREYLPHRVRKLLNGFLPDHLDTAYIAIWPEGEEAMAWLETAYLVDELGPIYVVTLMQDRSTLLPEDVVDPRALDPIKRFCDVPLSKPLTIEHLVKKGLLTSEGKLHDDVHILAVSGHHSTVAGQFTVRGVEYSMKLNPFMEPHILMNPPPKDRPQYILRRVRCFIKRTANDALALHQLAAAENRVELLLDKQSQFNSSAVAHMRNAVESAREAVGELLKAKLKLDELPTTEEILSKHSNERLPSCNDKTAHAVFRSLLVGGLEDNNLATAINGNQYPTFVKLVTSPEELYHKFYTFVKTYEKDELPEFGVLLKKPDMRKLQDSKKSGEEINIEFDVSDMSNAMFVYKNVL